MYGVREKETGRLIAWMDTDPAEIGVVMQEGWDVVELPEVTMEEFNRQMSEMAGGEFETAIIHDAPQGEVAAASAASPPMRSAVSGRLVEVVPAQKPESVEERLREKLLSRNPRGYVTREELEAVAREIARELERMQGNV